MRDSDVVMDARSTSEARRMFTSVRETKLTDAGYPDPSDPS